MLVVLLVVLFSGVGARSAEACFCSNYHGTVVDAETGEPLEGAVAIAVLEGIPPEAVQ